MSTHRLSVRVAESFRRAEFVRTGEWPEREAIIDVESRDLSEAGRRGLLANAAITAALVWGVRPPAPPLYAAESVQVTRTNAETVSYREPGLVAEPLTVDHGGDHLAEVAAELAALDARWSAVSDELAAAQAEHQRLRAERQAENERRTAAERAAAAEREAQATAAREQRETEKRAWIAAHGSRYLQRACAGGYDCQRRYVTERAAAEHAGYEVDFDGQADWQSRSCPSAAALEIAEATPGAVVVWLTEPVRVTDDYDPDVDEFEPCEAVVVREYLGKYDLVRTV